jgi:hypothetical protein
MTSNATQTRNDETMATLTKDDRRLLTDLLNDYVACDIQERQPGRWVAVDRFDDRVIIDTWSDSVLECERKTLAVAASAAAHIVQKLLPKPFAEFNN